MDAGNRFRRRLGAAILLTVATTSGCGWLGHLTADWPTLQRLPDRDLREPSSCGPLGRCFNQHQQGVDDAKTIADERSRNEAGYLSHNPGAKAP